MRIAWKVRVAGCLPGSRVGTAAEQIAASCAVRSIGSAARAATIARAMRFAKALLAQGAQDDRDVALAGARQPLRRSLSRLIVHAHVERPVLHETEAAPGLIELRRRDPEVHQHAVQPPFKSRRTDQLLEPAERPLHQRETWFPDEPHAAGPDRVRVPVDRDDAPPGAERAQNRCRVPAPPERRVAVPTVGPHREPGQHFVRKYRRVFRHDRA